MTYGVRGRKGPRKAIKSGRKKSDCCHYSTRKAAAITAAITAPDYCCHYRTAAITGLLPLQDCCHYRTAITAAITAPDYCCHYRTAAIAGLPLQHQKRSSHRLKHHDTPEALYKGGGPAWLLLPLPLSKKGRALAQTRHA